MTDFDQRLSGLNRDDLNFLAGMLSARGKVYIGRSHRGRSHRYSPSLSLELSAPMPDRLAALFPAPQSRAYYAHNVLRYVLQDTHRISRLLGAVVALMPDAQTARLGAMIAFCASQSDDEREKMYENFVTT